MLDALKAALAQQIHVGQFVRQCVMHRLEEEVLKSRECAWRPIALRNRHSPKGAPEKLCLLQARGGRVRLGQKTLTIR